MLISSLILSAVISCAWSASVTTYGRIFYILNTYLNRADWNKAYGLCKTVGISNHRKKLQLANYSPQHERGLEDFIYRQGSASSNYTLIKMTSLMRNICTAGKVLNEGHSEQIVKH